MYNELIIFSKNRACQLHLLLESIKLNSNNIFDSINVLYKADDNYVSGYDKLINNEKFKNINFIKETNFREDVLKLINNTYVDSITYDYSNNYITFLVDDAIIYDKITISKEKILEAKKPNFCCFSLRLGLNCNYSHPANINYTIKNYEKWQDDFILISHSEQSPGDFNYPLSTDGHIYHQQAILYWLSKINFNNPNTLEANLQYFSNETPRIIVFFKESKIVSVPVNLVNDTFKNRHGLQYYISEEELNEKYLNGYTIDINQLDFNKINGPHKEIEYKFKKE